MNVVSDIDEIAYEVGALVISRLYFEEDDRFKVTAKHVQKVYEEDDRERHFVQITLDKVVLPEQF